MSEASQSLASLTTLLRDQLHQLHNPRKQSQSPRSSRKDASKDVKLTLLRIRAALRSAREKLQNFTENPEISREFLRLRNFQYQRGRLTAAVARLEAAEFPQLAEATRTMEAEISDHRLLDALAAELGRREAEQARLQQLQEDRKFLESEISRDQQVSRKFLEKISALDDSLAALREVGKEISDPEISPDPLDAVRRERDALMKNPEKMADRKIYKISAQPLGDVGAVFRVAKTGDEKIFAEIFVHEKFPGLHIRKSLHGRVAASRGDVVDPALAEICAHNFSNLTISEIFAKVLTKLNL